MTVSKDIAQVQAQFDVDLRAAPPVIFLFGLTAAGKNFVGDVLARASGRPIYHADVDLTLEMKDALAHKSPFTPAMRDRFFEIVAVRINRLVCEAGPIIVTQAVYKREHRDYLRAKVSGLELVLVDALDSLIAERIVTRGGEMTQEYAELLRRQFEAPGKECKRILNNAGEEEVILQARELFRST